MSKPERLGPLPPRVVRNFPDLIQEAGMLPNGAEVILAITNPLEQHFLRVFDKHHGVEALFDEDLFDAFTGDEYD